MNLNLYITVILPEGCFSLVLITQIHLCLILDGEGTTSLAWSHEHNSSEVGLLLSGQS